MFMHFFGGAVANAAVARENPFELAGQQLFHGARLLLPGIPADIAKGCQRFAFGRPREMISREQYFIAIEKNLVATRVPGRGNELRDRRRSALELFP